MKYFFQLNILFCLLLFSSSASIMAVGSLDGCKEPLLMDSFESGLLPNNWVARDMAVDYPSLVDVREQEKYRTHGYYYVKLKRHPTNHGDPYYASDWIETGEDVSGNSFTLSMRVFSSPGGKTIRNIGLQRFPKDGTDWSNTYVSIRDVDATSSWKGIQRTVTFPISNNGNTSSRIRIILRMPLDDGEVMYDRLVLISSDKPAVGSVIRNFNKHTSITDVNNDGKVNIFDFNSVVGDVSYTPSLTAANSSCSVLIGGAGGALSWMEDNPSLIRMIENNTQIYALESDLKWRHIRPSRSSFQLGSVSQMIDWLIERDIVVHGHVLVWHRANPDWLVEGNYSANELTEILYEHIDRVVGEFKGKIAVWDVVNEAFDNNGELRSESMWLQGLGSEYIKMAFERANQADPSAVLLYNDYNTESINNKSNGIYNFLVNLKNQGVPIHAVGFQTHISSDFSDFNGFRDNVRRFGEAGFDVYFTEVDVKIPLSATWQDYQRQAFVYKEILNICLDSPYCKGFQTWGYSDERSWIPKTYPGFGDALLFDFNYMPKPAYCAVKERLSQCL